MCSTPQRAISASRRARIGETSGRGRIIDRGPIQVRGDFDPLRCQMRNTAAAQDCAESTAISQATGYVRAEAQAQRDWCRYLIAHQLWSAAAEHGKKALALFRKVGDRHGEATALVSLAEVLLRESAPSSTAQVEAQDYLKVAVELQTKHQWPSVAALLAALPAGTIAT